MDSFIVVPLVYVGFKCLDDISNQTPHSDRELMRSTLMLMINGLYQQRRNHYLSEVSYRVVWNRMRPQKVSLIKDSLELGEESPDQVALRQAMRSHWPVSIV
jgi:hypothetical protein